MERPDAATLALALLFCYLMGSIPFGLLFTLPRGVDPRKSGSGNIGATNVMRTAGKGAAAMTLVGDLLKGTAAVAVGKLLGADTLWQGILGLAAVAGHDFSVFLRLRGGKGVATSLGVLLLYAPQIGILTTAVWLIVVGVTKISSAGALVSFALMPFAAALLGYGREVVYVAAAMSLILIAKHGANIRRMFRGEEGTIGGKT